MDTLLGAPTLPQPILQISFVVPDGAFTELEVRRAGSAVFFEPTDAHAQSLGHIFPSQKTSHCHDTLRLGLRQPRAC